jgi:hypothetical protein
MYCTISYYDLHLVNLSPKGLTYCNGNSNPKTHSNFNQLNKKVHTDNFGSLR